jgi:hypothetical protein
VTATLAANVRCSLLRARRAQSRRVRLQADRAADRDAEEPSSGSHEPAEKPEKKEVEPPALILFADVCRELGGNFYARVVKT